MINENTTAILLDLYITVCAISIVGNILALIIFSRKTFQNTIFSTYFRFLTIFDILTILNGIDDLITLSGVGTYWTTSILTCKMAYLINYSMPSISSWILSLISIDRFLSIVKPVKYSFRKTVKFQLTACLIAVFFNFLFCIPITIFANINYQHTNETNIKCANHNEGIELINVIIGVVIPFSLMLISNIMIIKTIFKSRKNSISTTNALTNNLLLKDIKFSITSICLNVSFFLLNFPLSIYLVLKLVIEIEINADKNITITLSIFYYLHYGSLFYVSILINSTFRNEFFNLIREIKSKFIIIHKIFK
jgi:hypothetical protein